YASITADHSPSSGRQTFRRRVRRSLRSAQIQNAASPRSIEPTMTKTKSGTRQKDTRGRGTFPAGDRLRVYCRAHEKANRVAADVFVDVPAGRLRPSHAHRDERA